MTDMQAVSQTNAPAPAPTSPASAPVPATKAAGQEAESRCASCATASAQNDANGRVDVHQRATASAQNVARIASSDVHQQLALGWRLAQVALILHLATALGATLASFASCYMYECMVSAFVVTPIQSVGFILSSTGNCFHLSLERPSSLGRTCSCNCCTVLEASRVLNTTAIVFLVIGMLLSIYVMMAEIMVVIWLILAHVITIGLLAAVVRMNCLLEVHARQRSNRVDALGPELHTA